MSPSTILLTLLSAYALGTLNGGYYLVRWMRRRDVRDQGSGATGATNAALL